MLACTVGFALLPLTSTAFPGTNANIAFSTKRDGNFEIYTMTGSGATPTNRTNNAADDTNPTFSADGQKIAFVRGGSIYTMKEDGSALSTALGAGDEPFWSPDGLRIAFIRSGDIWTMGVSGGSESQLTTTAAAESSPAWSPNGQKIAFARSGDILTIASTGGSELNLTNSGTATDGAPAWSPDGSKIAFISTQHDAAGELYTMSSTDGATQTRLTSANSFPETSPSWSPDSTEIAFVRTDGGGNIDIHKLPSTGGSTTQLTSHSAIDQQPDWGATPAAPTTAPANTVSPVISGTTTVGSALSTTDGTWTGNPAPTFTYKWRRCDSAGDNCSDIPGATSSAYTLATADLNSTIRVVVTGTNSAGSGLATSAQTAVITGTGVPVNTVKPAISGSAKVGAILTTTQGTWSPLATTYTYQWKRCDAAGANCVNIPGATLASYTVTAAELAVRVLVAVTGSNSSGAGTAVESLPSEVVTAAAFANTTRPVISGTPAAGQTLTTTDGTWTATPTTITYQWKRCNTTTGACASITGATNRTYAVTSADNGQKLMVEVKATHTSGTATANSDQTAVVGGSGSGSGDKPVNKKAPVVSGQAAKGQTVRTTNGEWDGATPMTFAYQWQACDAGVTVCSPVQGATSATYTITSAQNGKRIRVRVTATNTAGSAAVASNATSVIGRKPASTTTGRKVVGTAKNDKLRGTAKNDILDGKAGNDTLNGLAGNDLLLGRAGNDGLLGGAGADQLLGGPGRDVFLGGAGNDIVSSAGDGARDVVDCGAGKDRATVGRTDAVRNCETVKRKKR